MSRMSRFIPLLLLVLLLLTACGRVAGEQSGPLSNGVQPESSAPMSGGLEENLPMAPGPTSSQSLPIEQRSAAYAPLLRGAWTASDGDSVWCFDENGTGTVSWLTEEELQSFDWSVLRDESGMDILYLFFDGSAAAARYLPVFDEGALELCDPEELDVLMTLEVTIPEG